MAGENLDDVLARLRAGFAARAGSPVAPGAENKTEGGAGSRPKTEVGTAPNPEASGQQVKPVTKADELPSSPAATGGNVHVTETGSDGVTYTYELQPNGTILLRGGADADVESIRPGSKYYGPIRKAMEADPAAGAAAKAIFAKAVPAATPAATTPPPKASAAPVTEAPRAAMHAAKPREPWSGAMDLAPSDAVPAARTMPPPPTPRPVATPSGLTTPPPGGTPHVTAPLAGMHRGAPGAPVVTQPTPPKPTGASLLERAQTAIAEGADSLTLTPEEVLAAFPPNT